ncbi:MAG: hypothetical protein AAGH79_14320 [Bacteroidota bacterium]
MLGMNQAHFHSALSKKGIHLFSGYDDPFQPTILLDKQATALGNARSITKRIFTATEHAD